MTTNILCTLYLTNSKEKSMWCLGDAALTYHLKSEKPKQIINHVTLRLGSIPTNRFKDINDDCYITLVTEGGKSFTFYQIKDLKLEDDASHGSQVISMSFTSKTMSYGLIDETYFYNNYDPELELNSLPQLDPIDYTNAIEN